MYISVLACLPTKLLNSPIVSISVWNEIVNFYKCMCASMLALPVVQPVATDGACSVQVPSLPLSIKQTEKALRIKWLTSLQNFVSKMFCNLLLQLKLISNNNRYYPNIYLYIYSLISVN